MPFIEIWKQVLRREEMVCLSEDVGICIYRSGIQSRDLKVTYIRLFLEKKNGRILFPHIPFTPQFMLHLPPLVYGKWSALVTNLIHVSG